ncbi:pentapeptide repeat-containing protein [uncultured Pseudoteredinibacter sp.]|uniref:pentapeptide repeat-containing protein n=1 Tax=uncultured Pseudoteredinibacter sp. TaxID=1641701 RepID=UPI00344374B4
MRLCYSGLRGSYLRGSCLRGSCLRGSCLRGSCLHASYLDDLNHVLHVHHAQNEIGASKASKHQKQ